jgi:peptidoglycan/LPS O-acetylase OafA/YrhL
MTERDVNLDRLRATAIALVVASHVGQMWPTPLPGVTRFTALGAYGVDLFFALSGWLIGGLFWREMSARGNVQVPRFVLRRVLRTVPCYLVALALAWGAVRVAEPQRAGFDWRYLFFLQNYEQTMPYFLVSWSLCIEEHFYLLMPIVMVLVCRLRPGLPAKLWPLCFLPWVLRSLRPPETIGMFGMPWTATHLRFEGLLAGVLAAWVARNDAAAWTSIVRWAKVLVVPLLGAGVIVFYVSHHYFYVAGLTFMTLGFLSLLVAGVGARPRTGRGHRFVKAVAVGSYSGYLTHALMIHLARRTIARFAIESSLLRLAIFGALIAGGATAFFWFVERPSLAVRDRLAPARR